MYRCVIVVWCYAHLSGLVAETVLIHAVRLSALRCYAHLGGLVAETGK